MQTRNALRSLQKLIRLIVHKGIKNGKDYSAWAKEHQAELEKLFYYERNEGMPPVNYLARPFFHPELPLIGWNYTPTAHNLLFAFQNGWTDPLRLCRGIVFDQKAKLIALPFPKFFNFGEHQETTELPNEPFMATVKYDGHLGIIFEYDGRLLLTTRGDFTSRTSVLGNQMLRDHANHFNWSKYNPDITLLVEIVCPETKIYLDYGDQRSFIIVGAYNRKTLRDYSYPSLMKLGKELNLPVAVQWPGSSLCDLRDLIADKTITNQEGFVARFRKGLRVKFKFQTYLQKMFEDSFKDKGYAALMQWHMAGKLNEKLALLPEELTMEGEKMWREILKVVKTQKTAEGKWRVLYKFPAPPGITLQTFQKICRDFVKSQQK